MTRKTITRLNERDLQNHEISKQIEVEYLEEIQASIPEGTYLASLFTDGFVSWFSMAVRNDMSTNMFLELNHFYADKLEAESKLAQANREIAELETQLSETRTSWELTYNDQEKELQAEIDYRKKLSRQRSARISELAITLQEVTAENRELKSELQELKAASYDVIVAKLKLLDS